MKNQNKDENPKYGWYVGNIILVIGILGGIGLILFILGFFLSSPINIILWIVGMTLSLVFLWPAVGLTMMNLWVPYIKVEYSFLKECSTPKILDCGCGTGRHAIQMAKQLPEGGFLTGIDIYDSVAISGSSLQRVQKNAELEGVADITEFRVGSITDIPFDEQTFDIVSVGSVMHEVHDDADKAKAYSEIYRVLKDDGLLYFGEWNRRSLKLILFTGIFALVFKSKKYWEIQLKIHGFNVTKTENMVGFIDYFCKKL
ncbi:MAG: class I SAM-dependent methyltransferase [Candidatus Helarchaeota archaeon]|nr:class I SAM-dependent methyltransferase [Candidatus Helarchaeota archaeon]